ncbi:MAG: hypothetical protein AABW56_04675 [Nanoarchaeota archaeon]
MRNTENKTKINWWELRNKEYLYLKNNILKNLINKGVKKAGSLSKLCIVLGTTHFYAKLNDNAGISLGKLKQLLDYLSINYNFINNKILEIRRGNKYSIKNPKLPIYLKNEEVGSLLGHMTSDGFLSYDKSRKDFIRTTYCSPDEELINEFVGDIKDVFGEVHFNESIVRNCKTIKFGDSIVGKGLRYAGAPVGKKYKLNRGIPWIINLNYKLKKNYLSAIFDDEGSVGELHKPYIILSRSIHINLTKEEENLVARYVKSRMIKKVFPTGHIGYSISIKNFINIVKNLDGNLCFKVLNAKPRLLLDESNLLRENFDIENFVYVITFSITNNGGYSVASSLVIRRKDDVVKFYKNIGFKLYRKQNRLKNVLTRVGWINNGY